MKTLKPINVLILLVTWAILSMPAMAEDLVRADFQSQLAAGDPGVFDYPKTSVPGFACDGDSGNYDFIDSQDSATCVPNPSAQSGNNNSNVSGGGRWHLNIWADANDRGITIDFSDNRPAGTDIECVALSTALDAIFGNGSGAACGCGGAACQYQVWVAADRLFKKGATEQTLGRFDIVADGGPALRIVYDNPLAICQVTNPDNKNWRALQSGNCGEAPGEALADLVIPPTGGSGQDIVLGRWNLPFQVTAHRVPLPSDDGDSGGGGGKPCNPKKPGCTTQ